MMINDDVNQKYLTKERIIELLKDIPDGAILSPNAIGNTAVFNNAEKCKFIGYIDFLLEGEFAHD